MDEFIQNIFTFEYNGNQSVDTSDGKDEEEDDNQTIALEPENEEDESSVIWGLLAQMASGFFKF